MSRNKPLILTILDGWGFSPAVAGNAVAMARKPNYDKLLREFPNTLVHTSGAAVGLPEGHNRILEVSISGSERYFPLIPLFDTP